MQDLMTSVMNGAKQVMRAQSVNSNNLANVSTTGFKKEMAHILGSDIEGGLRSTSDLSAGMLQSTGRDMDVSINGEGWIAIVSPDGTEAYTRRGDLKVDSLGQLTDGVGNPVIGNSGPVALPPFAAVEIADDGSISIQTMGGQANALAVIDRIKLVLPEEGQLKRSEDGLMRPQDNTVLPPDASVKLISRTLEGSNVNAVEEMVKMIDLARQFEAQIKLMKSAEENSSALAKIMSMN